MTKRTSSLLRALPLGYLTLVSGLSLADGFPARALTPVSGLSPTAGIGDTVADARVLVRELELQTETLEAQWRKSKANLKRARSLLNRLTINPDPDSERLKIEEIKHSWKLKSAERLYEPSHPEVIRERERLKTIRDRIKALENRGREPSSERP